jgi:hypothetical protein
MSAPFPMCRTLIFVLALVVWAGMAHGSPRTKVKPQHTTSASRATAAAKVSRSSAASKTTAHRKQASAVRSTAPAKSASRTRSSARASAHTSNSRTSTKTRTVATPASKSRRSDAAPQTSIATAKRIPASTRDVADAPARVRPAVIKVSSRRGRRMAARRASLMFIGPGMPAPLRGSAEILAHQNTQLEAEGLERIIDDTDLNNRIREHLLVPLPASDALTVNPGLPENRRYCRSWTAQFLQDLARAHAAAFHKPFIVSSAVRTIEYQKRLMRTNHNAAPAEGDIVSPHVMGATIDIAKSGLNRQEIAWMRNQLQTQVAAGNIDVEEEFRQACFHITVYRSYVDPTDESAPDRPGMPAAITETAAGE